MVLYKHRELIRNKKLMSHVSALEMKTRGHKFLNTEKIAIVLRKFIFKNRHKIVFLIKYSNWLKNKMKIVTEK